MVMNVAGRLVEACVALHRAIFTVGGVWRREEREKRKKARQDGEIFFHDTSDENCMVRVHMKRMWITKEGYADCKEKTVEIAKDASVGCKGLPCTARGRPYLSERIFALTPKT